MGKEHVGKRRKFEGIWKNFVDWVRIRRIPLATLFAAPNFPVNMLYKPPGSTLSVAPFLELRPSAFRQRKKTKGCGEVSDRAHEKWAKNPKRWRDCTVTASIDHRLILGLSH